MACSTPTATSTEWMEEVGSGVAGYQTPKVAVGAAVTNETGELLLIQRADSGVLALSDGLVRRWLLRARSRGEGGARRDRLSRSNQCDSSACSTGCDSARRGSRCTRFSSSVAAVGGEMNIHPLECTDAGWFTRDNLPSPTIGAERWAGPIFAAIDGETRDVFYDDLRRPVWRGDQ